MFVPAIEVAQAIEAGKSEWLFVLKLDWNAVSSATSGRCVLKLCCYARGRCLGDGGSEGECLFMRLLIE